MPDPYAWPHCCQGNVNEYKHKGFEGSHVLADVYRLCGVNI